MRRFGEGRRAALTRSQAGQATVELLVALPVLALVLVAAWQTIVAGHAVWSAAEAARLGAREYAVQRPQAGEAAARRRTGEIVRKVLPRAMRARRPVGFSRAGEVSVRARVPLVFPFSTVFDGGPSFSSRARFST